MVSSLGREIPRLKKFPRKKTPKKYDTSISPCPNCPNICLLDLPLPAHHVGCGTDKASIGWSLMLMPPNKLLANEHFPRRQSFLRLIAAVIWSPLPVT